MISLDICRACSSVFILQFYTCVYALPVFCYRRQACTAKTNWLSFKKNINNDVRNRATRRNLRHPILPVFLRMTQLDLAAVVCSTRSYSALNIHRSRSRARRGYKTSHAKSWTLRPCDLHSHDLTTLANEQWQSLTAYAFLPACDRCFYYPSLKIFVIVPRLHILRDQYETSRNSCEEISDQFLYNFYWPVYVKVVLAELAKIGRHAPLTCLTWACLLKLVLAPSVEFFLNKQWHSTHTKILQSRKLWLVLSWLLNELYAKT